MASHETADLWLHIDQLHLNYLKADDTASKVELRRKLEGYVHRYLCLVPQDRKFCSDVTAALLADSVRWLPGFSGLKAAQAFKALEEYAANLLNQPWRKEFKEIKQFGGFYKHNIECALSGAERLFHQMGYDSSTGQTLVMQASVDQDKVTTVARDCLLAHVECQILVSIVQGVSATFPCSWIEALNFRQDHIGTPEQAVRSLVYMKNQMQYQQQSIVPPAPPSSYMTANGGGSVYSPQPYYQAQQFTTPATSVMSQYTHQAHTSLQPHMYYQGNMNVANGNPTNHQSPGPMSMPDQSGLVPTAQLIDIAHNSNIQAQKKPSHGSKRASLSETSSHSYSAREGAMSAAIPLTIKHLEEENRRKSCHENGGIAGNSLDSWDYVYRQLETIGYTKDQSERPNVLHALLNKVSLARQRSEQEKLNHASQPHDEPDDGEIRGQVLSPLSREEEELLMQIRKTKQLDKATPTAPGDEVDDSDAVHRRLRKTNYTGSGGTRRDKDAQRAHNSGAQYDKRKSHRHSRPLSPPKPPPIYDARESLQPSSGRSNKWQCHACTFSNKARVEICEMCGKSRNSPDLRKTIDDVEEKHIHGMKTEASSSSLGVACDKCTLVNPTNIRICEACGATLPHWRQKTTSEEESSSEEA